MRPGCGIIGAVASSGEPIYLWTLEHMILDSTSVDAADGVDDVDMMACVPIIDARDNTTIGIIAVVNPSKGDRWEDDDMERDVDNGFGRHARRQSNRIS